MIKTLTKNMGVKIFCILAAGALWTYVAAGQNTVGKFPGSIKIKALNTPQNFVAIYDTKIVDIKIMAEPSIWQRLSADSFSAYVDLSALGEGTHEVPVNVTSSIPGVQVVEKNPEKIFVSLEPVVTKEVILSKRVEGSAAEGMVSGNITLNPDKVTIKGPKNLINATSEANVTIRLNGEEKDFNKSFSAFVIDEKGEPIKDIEITPSEVNASVSIVKSSNNKTLGIKVKTSGTPKSGYFISNITTDPTTIDVVGTKTTLSSLDYLETFAVDINGKSEDIDSAVGLDIKNGVALQSGMPTKIKVKIQFSATGISREIIPEVKYLNIPDSYNVSSQTPNQIKVICTGAATLISSLQSRDIFLIIDLSSFKPTKSQESFSIDLNQSNFNVPDGVTITSFLPTSINITLEKKS